MANQTATTGGETVERDVEFVPAQEMNDDLQQSEGTSAEGSNRLSGARQAVKAEATRAGDRLRAVADDGKSRATGALDDLANMIGDAAGTIDDKVGEQFGGYARQAQSAVADFSEALRNKEVDDLVDDAREFVRRSPGIAIGAAAALGFVVARVLRSGVDHRNA